MQVGYFWISSFQIFVCEREKPFRRSKMRRLQINLRTSCAIVILARLAECGGTIYRLGRHTSERPTDRSLKLSSTRKYHDAHMCHERAASVTREEEEAAEEEARGGGESGGRWRSRTARQKIGGDRLSGRRAMISRARARLLLTSAAAVAANVRASRSTCACRASSSPPPSPPLVRLSLLSASAARSRHASLVFGCVESSLSLARDFCHLASSIRKTTFATLSSRDSMMG